MWIPLVKYSSAEVSGPSEVPRINGKLFFSSYLTGLVLWSEISDQPLAQQSLSKISLGRNRCKSTNKVLRFSDRNRTARAAYTPKRWLQCR